MTDLRPITIAISAMGGQGGGVLSNWIRDMAESNGYVAQSTSVPGVAQRTGATIYYLELFSQAEVAKVGRPPVLAMTPVPGDVDIVIAAELVEAGRAMQRGFVSPDRTTLITTTHRSYTVEERQNKGNGLVDSDKIVEIAEQQAKTLVAFDMQQLATETGSVISSVLFGALAGSGQLPFSKQQFEQAVTKGGIAVATNLVAFNAAYVKAQQGNSNSVAAANDDFSLPAQVKSESAQRLLARVKADLPAQVQGIAFEGVRQLVDYQDPEYADQYLDVLTSFTQRDTADKGYTLSVELARNLALWMAFQDTIRVADQKTRASRMAKIRQEVEAKKDQLVYPVEFLHPRLEEICDSMPKALGQWVLSNKLASGFIKFMFQHGKKVQTAKLGGFLMLYIMAGMRGMRRKTLRYAVEHKAIGEWLSKVKELQSRDYDMAVELIKCQRLIKGYGATHALGKANFEKIIGVLASLTSAQTLADLQAAALEGEDNKAFDAMLQAL